MSARTGQELRIDGDLILMVGGNSWTSTPYGQHHLARHLSRRMPVLWVDSPVSYLTPLNDASAATTLRDDRLRFIAPNLLRVSPVTVPGTTRPILRDVARRQAQRAVRRAVDRLGARVHSTIIAGLGDMMDVAPGAQRVLFGTDDYVAGAELMGLDPRWLGDMERRQLAMADVVVAISPMLQEKWALRRPDVKLIPNGCDAERFAGADDAPLPADVRLKGPIAGFVGHMSERIDVSMLEAVAASGASLLLVGPRQASFEIAKLEALLARPNVQWVGPKPFENLPSYLRVIDVGLTPYQQSDFNHACFPLKTLEYLAAGRPAVVSDLPAHRWLQTDHVTIADTAEQFAARVQALLAASGGPQEVDARRAFAQRHSWAARADDFAQLLGLGAIRPATPAQAA